MLKELLDHPKGLLLSIALHAMLLGLVAIQFDFSNQLDPASAGQTPQVIQTEVINSQQLEEKRRQTELELQRKADVERQRQEDEKRRADAERQRQKDEKRKAELKRQQEAEAKSKAEEERKAEQIRAAAEKKRKAEEARVDEEKRKAEEARKRQEAEEQRRIEEARQRQEAELKAQLEAEENERRLALLREQYVIAIHQKVKRNWLRPPGNEKMPACEVRVTQGPGGIVLGVTFGACGGTETYRNSIEKAVLRAEPLPKPADPALFERNINIIFRP